MAINPSTKYPGQTVAPSASYPLGSAQNVTVSGDGTGTPLEKDWLNDLLGFEQALLARAGIIASGTPDAVGASDFLDSLSQWIGTIHNLVPIGHLAQDIVYNNDNVFDVIGQIANIGSCAVNDDGTKVYVSDTAGPTIFEYNLSVPWDVSTAVFSTASLTTLAQTGAGARSFDWSLDGTKLLVLSNTNDAVYQYNASTPFDLSTAVYSGNSFSFAAQTTAADPMTFANSGLKMYIADQITEIIYEYTLGTAFDLSTAAYSGNSFNATAVIASPGGITFSNDGHRFLALSGDDNIYQFNLRTAFDISTAFDSGIVFSLSSFSTGTFAVRDLVSSFDGTKAFFTTAELGVDLVHGANMGRMSVGP